MKKTIIVVIILAIIGIFFLQNSITGNAVAKEEITVFKSPTCGCCTNYIPYLKQLGKFNVKTINTDDMNHIKDKFGVPASMESCHTIMIGNYFVEGHVPMKAIEKLLEEQPDIKGIALPGMPEGSLGMPGPKTEQFIVYAIQKDGTQSEFMRL